MDVASPISLIDVIKYFNYDYYSNAFNVTSFKDFIVDKNSDGTNDTLVIELITKSKIGNYTLVVDIFDGNVIITNSSNILISSPIQKINISFPTEFFNGRKFNYSVKIFERNFSRKFVKETIETNTYLGYENSTRLIDINDYLHNGSIFLNITFDILENKTYELVYYFKLNDIHYFLKNTINLTKGKQSIQNRIINTNIKSRHLSGNILLTAIRIDNALLKTNYQIKNFNNINFSGTKILSVNNKAVDSDNNSRLDYIEFNVTISSDSNGTYDIFFGVSDSFNTFFKKLNQSVILNEGINNVIFKIDNTIIQKKKIDGAFKINYVRIKKNLEILNEIRDIYLNETFFYDYFENSNLADLALQIEADDNYKYGINNLSVNLTLRNVGNSNSFNVRLEIFDNNSFSRNISKNIVGKGSKEIFPFFIDNFSSIELIALVDSDYNKAELSKSNNFLRKVFRLNNKPVINKISDISINETDLAILEINVTDLDNDDISYSLNMSQFVLTGNRFIWNTSTMDSGNYTALLRAYDKYLSDDKIINIYVNDMPDLDSDNDGIVDSLDKVLGTNRDIKSSIFNLVVSIDNLTDFSKVKEELREVRLMENSSLILKFPFNFSNSKLNLSAIVIEKQKENTSGFVFVKGLNIENRTKTLFVDRINKSQNGICIKDSEISGIDEISENCSLINEYKVECDEREQFGYICTFINYSSKYEVSNLRFSGIKQIEYYSRFNNSKSEIISLENNNFENSGSGIRECLEIWECTEWGLCENEFQKRACVDIRKCGTFFSKPEETKKCGFNGFTFINFENKTDSILEKEGLRANEKMRDNKLNVEIKYMLPDISAFLLTPSKNADKKTGYFIVFLIVGFGLMAYFYINAKKRFSI